MKKFLLTALAIFMVTPASTPLLLADIHEPPLCKWSMTRKLSRGLANIFYAPLEIPSTYKATLESEGQISAASYGLIHGVERTAVRMGFGLVELVTFPLPSYKGSYRSPMKDGRIYSNYGYNEFAPAVGFASERRRYNTMEY